MKNKNFYSAVSLLFSLMIGAILGIVIKNMVFGTRLGLIFGAVSTVFFYRKKK